MTDKATIPPLTGAELDNLEALARAATPGEWTACPFGRLIGGPLRHYVNGSAQAQIASFNVTFHDQAPDDEPERQQANTEFVAAISPPTALALIAQARAQQETAAAPRDCRTMIANLASVVRGQNGNRHADINELLAQAERLLATPAAPMCPTCKGNDANAPCAYPGEGKPGCLRDARIAAAPDAAHAQQDAAPADTVLVPRTITEDMHVAAVRVINRATGNADWPPMVWAAMLAATPAAVAHSSPDLAALIHYPECWDTAAYPTLAAALHECVATFRCSEHAAVAPSDAKGKADDLATWKKRALEAEERVRVYDQRIVDLGVLSMRTAVERPARLAAPFCEHCGYDHSAGPLCKTVALAKGKADAAIAGGVDWGLEIAALHLDKQREEHDREHARQEWDTGAWVFDRPEQEEYSNLLDELAEEIRALKGKTAATSAADAKDAARYRVLRQNVKPVNVSIIMTGIPPAGQSLAERIDMLCDGFIERQRAAIASTQQGGA